MCQTLLFFDNLRRAKGGAERVVLPIVTIDIFEQLLLGGTDAQALSIGY